MSPQRSAVPPAPRPKTKLDDPLAEPSRARLAVLRIVALVIFALLVGRMWHVQAVRGPDLRDRARQNRFVPREIEADRGVMYDAGGRQVVFNEPRWTVSVVPAALGNLSFEDRERILTEVATTVRRPWRSRSASRRIGRAVARDEHAIAMDEDLAAVFGRRRSIESFLPHDATTGRVEWSGWSPIPIDRNVPRDAAFELMESAHGLPGVLVEPSSVREYPAGPTLAHILGFTGSIPQEPSGVLSRYLERGYRIYDIVGRDGLEATYEEALRGVKGQRTVMVDVMGRELSEISVDRQPIPGANLHLTIDLEFQRAAEAALAAGLERVGAGAGAVAALDPRDGAVRALVTMPNYDNNLFSTGASPDEFVALLSDPGRPLINRALAGQPPGSTFKIITAAGALQDGDIDLRTHIHDPGVISIPNQYDESITYDFVCWLRSGHGSLNVVEALAHSCDVFFYQVAGGYYEHGANQSGLGIDRLADYSRAFGLGRRTEIELLGESPGLVPTPGWLAEYNGEVWTTGRTYNVGIGQGDVLASPLQMANAVAAVANGGTLYRPHLVERVEPVHPDAPQPDGEPGGTLGRLPVDPMHLASVRDGMLSAVRYGTAQPWLSGLPTEVAIGGKTGTAEFTDVDPETGRVRYDDEGNLLTHAWFVAFAPAENPEIALAVFIDGSGLDDVIQGSEVAAPIAADILRDYFDLPPRSSAAPSVTPCEDGDCPDGDGGTGTPAGSPQDGPPQDGGSGQDERRPQGSGVRTGDA